MISQIIAGTHTGEEEEWFLIPTPQIWYVAVIELEMTSFSGDDQHLAILISVFGFSQGRIKPRMRVEEGSFNVLE